jgi:ligand-binding SRPBCC domain-containing protein
MPRIELATHIAAPIERVFDLSRSIDAHQQSQSTHNEMAIAGRTSGLIEAGEQVTWQATHFGVRQSLTSRIESMERPKHFRDSMVSGAFKRIDHDHYFEAESADRTIMRDVFEYEAPLGLIGQLADALFLKRYMRRLLVNRNQVIKELAESDTVLTT